MRFQTSMIVAAVATAVISSSAIAAPAEQPQAFVKRVADQLIVRIKSGNASNPAVAKAIATQVLEPHVDVNGFVSTVMGTYYKTATPAQRAQFTKNFRTSILNTYAVGLSKYANNKYAIRPFKNTGSATPVVSLDLTSASGQKIPVAFQLSAVGNQWKVRGVAVNGINLGATFRDQFKSVVQQNGGNLDKAIASFKPNADAAKK